MDYFSVFEINAAGMQLQKLRADVASTNIANMHTTRTLAGGPYQPMAVRVSFANTLDQMGTLPAPTAVVETLNLSPKQVFEPNHPDASEKGLVAYPNITHLTEMINLMSAHRAYQANIAAFNANKAMALKALEIGGR